MDLVTYNKVVGSTADEFADLGLDQSQLFVWQIGKQNAMYELPVNTTPTLDGLGESPVSRMQGFMKTLQKEMDEGLEILALFKFRERLQLGLTKINTVDLMDVLAGDDIDPDRSKKLVSELVANIVAHRRVAMNLAAGEDAVDCDEVTQIDNEEFDRQLLVMLSDWLGDMQVYNRSEAMKYGIPLEAVLMCIMGSNFTKLGANGEVLKDANGKFLKGPNFVAPEAHIYATLFEQDSMLAEYQERVEELESLGALAIPALHNPTADAVDALFETDDELDMGSDEEIEPDE